MVFTQVLSLYECCFCAHVIDNHDKDIPDVSSINIYSNRLYNVAIISYFEVVLYHIQKFHSSISEKETKEV